MCCLAAAANVGEGGNSRALTRACCVHRSARDVRRLRVAAVAMLCTQKQGEMLPKFPEWWVACATPMWGRVGGGGDVGGLSVCGNT